MWNNEVELDKSANRLDEQFAVLARMLFVRFNELIMRVDGNNTIDEGSIEAAFREWADFRARPDFRDLMMEWFLGVPLKDLPPAPKPKQEEPPAEAPDQEAEGPQEFGGDYAEGQSGSVGDEAVGQGQPENEEDSKENEVPKVQDDDDAKPVREGAALP